MRIAEGMDVKIGVFDIETYVAMFDIGVYDPDTKEWYEWEVSEFRNNLDEFVKFYTANKRFDYWVSFNGIGFDHQVLEYIVNNYQAWYDMTNLEIAKKISEFGSRVIEDQGYNIQPPYRENQFSVKPIDVFRIHHMDNEAKRTSLKWCEYMLNMDVEEMPVDFKQASLTEEEIEGIKHYRRHDVLATLEVLKLTLGEVDLPELKDYKGKNKIQDRFDVMQETGMDCLNWSDVKIGEEWNKLDYCKAEKVKDMSLLFNRKVKQPYGQPFRNFFPKTMVFQTKHFRDFAEMLGNETVKRDVRIKGTNNRKKQEYTFTVGKTTYTIAKGGLHSTEKNRTIKAIPGWNYTDIDVGSQYPNSIVKLLIYAPHLAFTIMAQFKEKIKRRFTYKDEAKRLTKEGKDKEARPYNSVQEMLKLCLNGGYYGKLGQPGSFLEYPEGLLKVCMSNQMEILMLIEMMEMNGIQVMSGNTDGITCYYPDSKKEMFLAICTEWEKVVGNVEMGKLEHTEFECVWQDAVNSYIAKKTDGKVKKKGKFLTEFEMNKNKSQRIIALALEAYFVEGKDPIEFITNHDNIFDFCIGKKAGKDPNGLRDLWYEELISEDKVVIHNKILRYYVSNSGCMIKKRGFNNEGDKVDSYCEAPNREYFWMPQPLLKNFNRFEKKTMAEYDINYAFYILKVFERIDDISKSKKAKYYAEQFKPAEQISLF